MNMAGIIFWIILIGGVYIYFKFLKQSKYRIMLIDPITRKLKWLSGIDGIRKKYSYTSSPSNAMVFNNLGSAKNCANFMPKDIEVIIEIKTAVGWNYVNLEENKGKNR